MSTPPTPPAPQTQPDIPVTIPLTPSIRAAYQAVYDSIQTSIKSTTNVAILGPLNDARDDVDDVLTKDSLYRLHADTDLFKALTAQIHDTNENLVTLTQQIAAIASHIAIAGDVVAAIGKLLSLLPAA